MDRWERKVPECVTLPVQPGVAAGDKPPVRIFLGTEASQFRPERVFVWSIEQVRDPARIYEIYIMKELAGFDRSGWTTGFTNYRFAIPHLAGQRGRAIYNDEDQIYLTDPAELFDLDMQGAGFLAINETESSVMLIDCERMAEVWPLQEARRGSKKALLRRALARGTWGALDGHWNARDEEYREGRSHCLHYTTLHTQPWRPFPERFVYQDNPLAQLWHDLERGADEKGFLLFGRSHPTTRFRELLARAGPAEGAPRALPAAPIELVQASGAQSVHPYSPWTGALAADHDGVVAATGSLERVPEDDLPWVLDEMFRHARRFVFAAVDVRGVHPPGPLETSVRTAPERWPQHFEAASRRNPGLHWELEVLGDRGVERFRGGRFLGDGPPRVWVLRHAGDPEPRAAIALAAELGFPTEQRDAGRLTPPWPDLVLCEGERAAAAARRLRRETRGATRVVALGPEAGARAEDFDLAVTPLAAGYFPHPRRLETLLPLLGPAPSHPAEAEWRRRFATAPRPRVALRVGGVRGVPHADLAAVASDALRDAQRRGGSLFAWVDPHFPVELLRGAQHVERSADDEAAAACLAPADEFRVAGEAEVLLARVCELGRPLTLAPLPERPRGRERLRRWAARLAQREPSNNRGTTRPQQGLELLGSRLIAQGRIRPPRQRARMEATLVQAGLARRAGSDPTADETRPLRQLHAVAVRVQALLGLQ